MDEKLKQVTGIAGDSAPPSYQALDNQDQGYQDQGYQENPGYGCTPVPPPQVPFNPTYNYPPTTQPGYQHCPGLIPAGGIGHPVTVAQTGATPVVVNGTVPHDYRALAWFSLLCCCWPPLGVVAVINSNNTRYALQRGDLASAFYHSKRAKTFSIVSIISGFFFTIAVVVFILLEQ